MKMARQPTLEAAARLRTEGFPQIAQLCLEHITYRSSKPPGQFEAIGGPWSGAPDFLAVQHECGARRHRSSTRNSRSPGSGSQGNRTRSSTVAPPGGEAPEQLRTRSPPTGTHPRAAPVRPSVAVCASRVAHLMCSFPASRSAHPLPRPSCSSRSKGHPQAAAPGEGLTSSGLAGIFRPLPPAAWIRFSRSSRLIIGGLPSPGTHWITSIPGIASNASPDVRPRGPCQMVNAIVEVARFLLDHRGSAKRRACFGPIRQM